MSIYEIIIAQLTYVNYTSHFFKDFSDKFIVFREENVFQEKLPPRGQPKPGQEAVWWQRELRLNEVYRV